MRAPVLLSWSGGKDAAWALHALRRHGRVEVVGLLSTITAQYERISMQGIRTAVLHAQADAVGLPVIEARIPRDADNEAYVASFAAGLTEARTRWPGLETIAFGDLFLADIRDWRTALCARLGWTAHFPLFGRDTAALAQKMIDGGLRALISSVDTTRLDPAFAGRAFDRALLAALPDGVDPCGENGEFHTLVVDGPMLSAPLSVAAAGATTEAGRFRIARHVLT